MTTYVLGAGASRDAGYPLASELGTKVLDWLPSCTLAVHPQGNGVHELGVAYGGDLRDLEKILEELDTCPSDSGAALLDPSLRGYAKQGLRLMVPELFRNLRQHPAPLLERLARERIRAGDTVITFNYDVACERELQRAELWNIGEGYGFSLGIDTIPKSQVQVLKLHGSTNWLEPFFGGNTGAPSVFDFRPVILPGEFAFLGYPSELRDPRAPLRLGAAFPAIIMPGLKKIFHEPTPFGQELIEFWDNLWIQAADALRVSERIVIIGYSMPLADERARSLLLKESNSTAQIEIFCGRDTEPILGQFAAAGFPCRKMIGKGNFEDFLND